MTTKPNTQLQAINEETAIVGTYTQKHLDTLKYTIAKGTSNEQFALFVQTCVRTGLDPFLNQIYCIVYNGKDGPVMSMQIAVEGIVALAKKHPQYKGFIASEVKEEDEFEIDMVTGEPKHRIVSMQRGKTVGAYCVAYREGAPNIAVIITTDQVEHLVKGRNGQMWKDYFDDMIVKHAIKRAFKRQYGIEVSEDEFGTVNQSSLPDAQPPQRRDITVEANAANTAGQQQQQNSSDTPPSDDEAALKQARAEMKAKFKQLGITEPTDMEQYIKDNAKIAGEKPTLAEFKKLFKIMDMHIAEKQAQQSSDDELE